MKWPDWYMDRRGFRGPWRLVNGQWERRCHPSAVGDLYLQRGCRDAIMQTDGLGHYTDAKIIVVEAR